MQINSISSAQAFSGAEKKANKKAIAAGVVGAAAVAGTVALALYGKKSAVAEEATEQAGNIVKKYANYVADGAKKLYCKAQEVATKVIDTVTTKIAEFKKPVEEVVEEAAEEIV